MTTISRIYSDMIDDLVADLTGRSDVRRASAVERCAGLPEDLLLEITSRLLVQYHKQVAWRWSAFLLGAIGAVSFAYVLQGNLPFAYGIAGLAIARHLQLRYRHTGRSLQALLQNSEDKRLIPILLLRYSSRDGVGLRPQVVRFRDLGLTQLLPYVAQSDDELWTSPMRRSLASLLRSPQRNVAMTHSVLHALSEIGDEAALTGVLPLAAPISNPTINDLRTNRTISVEVQDAASKCVEAIRNRVERRRQSAVLLRACAADVSLPVSLPRAVDGSQYSCSYELVRSADVKINTLQDSGERCDTA